MSEDDKENGNGSREAPTVFEAAGKPFVFHVIDNLEPGGAQNILLALTRGNPEARVCVLHARGGIDAGPLQIAGVETLASSKYAVHSILIGLVRVIQQNRANAFFVAHLDASTILLCVLRKFIDFRLVVTLHAIQAQWPRWFSALFRRVIFYADHVVSGGRTAYDETKALGLPAERITLIPIGSSITIGAGPSADIRAELGIPADTPIFLNIARMVPGKGQIDLVRAMVHVPQAIAIIVGYGPEDERLRREALALGVAGRIRFVGRRTDLNNFYSTARSFVMPCLDESMGVVVYDALMYQLPVVAYASGTIGEIVKDGINGFLLAPDVAQLAAALNRVLRPETAFQFLPAQSYSAATMLDRHRCLYHQLARRWLRNPWTGTNA